MIPKDHVFSPRHRGEFAIVEPQTGDLRSHIQEILEGGTLTLKDLAVGSRLDVVGFPLSLS